MMVLGSESCRLQSCSGRSHRFMPACHEAALNGTPLRVSTLSAGVHSHSDGDHDMPRTTHRSKSGTKLYAKRGKSGEFEDIQTYKRAHGQDVKRSSVAERAAGKKKAAKKTTLKPSTRKPAKKK